MVCVELPWPLSAGSPIRCRMSERPLTGQPDDQTFFQEKAQYLYHLAD
jgi:hypothetical protein